jgi:serine/threonine protein kinase
MTNLIGQSLGRYHILEQLGEGGMATVYKAYDTRLERHVAIKVIRNDLFGPTLLEHMLKRFEREARALAKLSHPNIVKVLDFGEHDGAPYLVMEYLPGGTLKQRLGGGRFAWQDAIRLLTPIAQALAHAHAAGIVHRDIKPSNILITQTGEPMLSDFGIAKILDSEETRDLTGTGAGIGTPEYMAPEQGMGQTDERADIYALGIVLYQMITGHVPFRADTPMAILLKKSQEALPRPKQFVRDLPDAVENVLIKALYKDPANRFQTAQDVVTAFGRLAAGGDRSVTTLIEQPARKPNWTWIAAGVGALVVLLTCLIVGVVLGAGFLSGNRMLPSATASLLVVDTGPGPATEAPTLVPVVFTFTPPPTVLPTETPSQTPIPPTATSSLSDPREFAYWYFNALWTERDYQFLWDNCQTQAFHEHASGGSFSDYKKWWSSVRQVDVISVEVIQNDGYYAWIRVTVVFHMFDGRTLSSAIYDYDLTYNSQSGLWMFDYRK